MTYIPLHVHDTFGSCGDSILRIPNLVAKAKELGCPALAITNHGSMATFVSFYEKCKKSGINPIVGCEFYYVPDRTVKEKETRAHIILLAKNYEGLKNLIRIHNDASEHFYTKPRTDIRAINKYHKGLICLTACVSGPIGTALKEHDFEKILRETLSLKAVFGDDLYLEVQPGRFKEQIVYNDLLVVLGNEFGVKLVATNDIHYLDRDQAQAHNWHVKDSRKDVGNIDTMVYPDTCYYLMDESELKKAFFRTSLMTDEMVDGVLLSTNEIAEKCNLVLPEEHYMPQFDPEIDEQFSLSIMCIDRLLDLKDKLGADYEIYDKRLDFELATIDKLGFAGYFLIVKDIIDYCDKKRIPRGPGRGSCAGSLVSYLLGISVADPIRYGLLFERFLSVNRKALPDIDLDLSPSRKNEVYDYIIERYGKNRCCYVSTFNMRKARNAIKTAARLLGIPPKDANIISNAIPEAAYDELGERQTNISISEAYETQPDFQKVVDNYTPKLLEVAKAIEGYPSSVGIHPAGIVISPVDISDRYPLVKVKDPKTGNWRSIMATSLDLHDVEKLSGVKFDLLSLSSLDVIYQTIQDVGVEFDFADEKLLDSHGVWKLISSKYTAGLFQISSATYRSRMPELHPKNIEQLAACLALVRGPCISNGTDKLYMDIANGRRQPEEIHPLYWDAVKETYGILIYQEQILKICTNIGFDSENAYNILKAVSKKKLDKIKSYEAEFFAHGREKDIADETLKTIWQKILDSGLYCFNKSHAVSYALVCYESAYLKYFYVRNYMCNVLTKEAEQNNKPEVLANILNECRELGIKFLKPDINHSKWEFTVEGDFIRIGYCAVKGLGESVYKAVKASAPYTGFEDFLKRASGRVVNKKPILIMIAAGMFSNTDQIVSARDLAYHYMTDIRKEKEWSGQIAVGTNLSVNIEASYDKIYKVLLGSQLYFF